jgi:hypothetical protein
MQVRRPERWRRLQGIRLGRGTRDDSRLAGIGYLQPDADSPVALVILQSGDGQVFPTEGGGQASG